MTMLRRRHILACAAIALAACSSTDSTAPTRVAAPSTASFAYGGDTHNGYPVPGTSGNASASTKTPLQCSVATTLTGSAVIGPNGGVLDVGPHRLIVPPGALTTTRTLSATVPAGNSIQIQFAPEGLHFQKPAGLILDASSCGSVPNAVYIDEIGGENEHLTAIFSNWWHVIAVPLDHFSLYAIDV
jgi:hypothetical protein